MFSTSTVAQSNIGTRPIKFGSDVTVALEPYEPTESFPDCKTQVRVRGPLGDLTMPIKPFVTVSITKDRTSADGGSVARVTVDEEQAKKQRAMWGTTRTLIANMVTGVTEGFLIPIRIVGVGYRAQLETPDAKEITLRLGYAHPIFVKIPDGVKVMVPAPQRIILQGPDLQVVTQFAADIRKWRKPEPYNQKGIFVGDETIKKKEGKKR